MNDAPPSRRHAVLHVYLGSAAAQSRLLAEAVGPEARALVEAGALARFWPYRFDARGPHVAVLLGGPATRAEEARARLAARVEAFLASAPEGAAADPAEAERRHAACRGKVLSPLDALPGLAPSPSYAFAEAPERGYFFNLAPGMELDTLEPLLAEVALWAADRLRAEGAAGSAVRWVAALGRALERAGVDAAACWRLAASTYLLGLAERIAAEDPELAASLPRLVGERNVAVMDRLWDDDGGAAAAPGMERLAALVAGWEAPAPGEREAFVREVAHCVLSQLDQPVRFRVPLVLYAWHRARAGAEVPA